MTSALAVATTFWGLIMALSPLMQVRLILRIGNAAGTSIVWIVVLKIGLILWLAYGVATGSAPLIITNAVSVTVSFVLLGVVLVLRHRQRVSRTPARTLSMSPTEGGNDVHGGTGSTCDA